jgi:DNA-binding NarL/FixJ family response regulator
MNTPLRIAIVDDHPIVIEGLRRILQQQFPHAEVSEFHRGLDFTDHFKTCKTRLDLILLDITLPDTNGVELCRSIKLASPDTHVLGFSNHNDRALVMQMLSVGASGYILKNASSEEITRSITLAMQGQLAFSEEVKTIVSRPSASDFKSLPPLTKREKQVLKMISDGHTSTEIAEVLNVSPFTVETHRRNLMQKFDAKNAAHLLKIAGQMKLI